MLIVRFYQAFASLILVSFNVNVSIKPKTRQLPLLITVLFLAYQASPVHVELILEESAVVVPKAAETEPFVFVSFCPVQMFCNLSQYLFVEIAFGIGIPFHLSVRFLLCVFLEQLCRYF
jgi:hypothetical protein